MQMNGASDKMPGYFKMQKNEVTTSLFIINSQQHNVAIEL